MAPSSMTTRATCEEQQPRDGTMKMRRWPRRRVLFRRCASGKKLLETGGEDHGSGNGDAAQQAGDVFGCGIAALLRGTQAMAGDGWQHGLARHPE